MAKAPSLTEFAETFLGQPLQPYQRALLDAIEKMPPGAKLIIHSPLRSRDLPSYEEMRRRFLSQ